MKTVEDKVHSHNSNCIYSVAKSNGDSIEFSLSIAEQRAVGFIPAWSLAFLQVSAISGGSLYERYMDFGILRISQNLP